MLQWILARFGGWVLKQKRGKIARRDHWLWYLRGNKACHVLESLAPYLIVKKAQADVAITFQKRQHSEKNVYCSGKQGPVMRDPIDIGYKEYAKEQLHALKAPHPGAVDLRYRAIPKKPVPCGSAHPQSVLTEAKVLEIRSLWEKGETPCRELAARYGVSEATISNIVYGWSWKHVRRDTSTTDRILS